MEMPKFIAHTDITVRSRNNCLRLVRRWGQIAALESYPSATGWHDPIGITMHEHPRKIYCLQVFSDICPGKHFGIDGGSSINGAPSLSAEL